MNHKWMLAGLMVLGLAACNDQTTHNEETLVLDNDVKKFSYAMGLEVGGSLKNFGSEVDAAAFSQAVSDALTDTTPMMAIEEATKIKQDFFMKRQQEQMAQRSAAGAANKAEGEAFLAKNKAAAGVQTTASGLQYLVLTPSEGVKPQATDTVKVHYRGTLINGEEFDSSYARGEPISFPLNGVIKGWTEGVALMPVGSKYKFFIPSDLAYGERGAGAKIGANATLIFEVELLAIEKKG